VPARTLNLGILAHVDAGKTTLTERLLHTAGVIHDLGSVDSGTTQTDTLALERRRGITIRAAVVAFPLDGTTVNVIDTPGHPDFIAEVERALAVLDGAVLVLSAVEGVQPQTRVLMRALRRLRVPTLLFVNKIDRSGADPDRVLAAVAERLVPRVVPMGTVAAAGSRAAGFTAYRPDDATFRSRLLDVLADDSDALVAEYVDDGAVTEVHLYDELVAQVAAARLHPVFFGSAATGAGVPELMDGIDRLLPAASPDPEDAASGTVFKIERGRAAEKVAYVRLWSGTVRVRDRLPVAGRESAHDDKVTGISVLEHGRWVDVPCASAGQIARLRGLAGARVGDGLGATGRQGAHEFAPPTLEAGVAPRHHSDGRALNVALAQLAEQDPLIAVRQVDGDGVTVSLYGRVQQEVIQATLADEYGIEVDFREATVLHVERPRSAAVAAEALHAETNPYSAGLGLRIEPGPPGSGGRVELDVPAKVIPLYAYKSVGGFTEVMARHVRAALARGLRGWEVTDCVVTVVECAYSSADGPPSTRGPLSTPADYRRLLPLVLGQALGRAGTVVCEPVLRIDLEAPTSTMDAVQRALGTLGAAIERHSGGGGLSTVVAVLPVARLHALQRQLPDLTGGEGVIESRYAGHEPVRGRPPVRPGFRVPAGVRGRGGAALHPPG